jgi:hypothetical protein
MTKFLATLILAGSLAVAACGGGDAKTDARVDQIMAELDRTDLSDAERDEMRDGIDDALDALPASEHDEYLDTLLESTRDMTDAVNELDEEFGE